MIIRRIKNYIVVELPITSPTSKFRLKRPVDGFISEPVACRSAEIKENDYIEWQISYDTDNLHEESIVKKVVMHKEEGVRYGCELVKLMVEGYKLSLLTGEQISSLNDIIRSGEDGLEESEMIVIKQIEKDNNRLYESYGFTKNTILIPNYIKYGNNYSVEIKIAHKQRAVGYQSMIYLNLPISACRDKKGGSLVGRMAEIKEVVEYVVDESNNSLISDTLLAFAIASRKHRNDIRLIFKSLGYGI